MKRIPRALLIWTAAASVAVLASCGDDPNTDGSGDHTGSSALNRPPSALFASNPNDSDGRIQGDPPLEVTLNMCGSTDPDRADELRYEYWWNSEGTGNPDAIGACRLSHTYSGRNVCVPAVSCVWDRQPGADHRVCKRYSICMN